MGYACGAFSFFILFFRCNLLYLYFLLFSVFSHGVNKHRPLAGDSLRTFSELRLLSSNFRDIFFFHIFFVRRLADMVCVIFAMIPKRLRRGMSRSIGRPLPNRDRSLCSAPLLLEKVILSSLSVFMRLDSHCSPRKKERFYISFHFPKMDPCFAEHWCHAHSDECSHYCVLSGCTAFPVLRST